MTDRKIVDYKVARQPIEVEHLIQEGWQPYGYPDHFINDNGNFFSQAMVKYEDVKEPSQKDFNEYLRKRLTKDEIEKIEKEAEEEFKLMLKFSRLSDKEI